MIRKENLEEMLKVIGYVRDAHKKIYEKRYADFDCVIEVDFTGSGSIRYPEDKGMKITAWRKLYRRACVDHKFRIIRVIDVVR